MNQQKLNELAEQIRAKEPFHFEPMIECLDHAVSRETFSLLRYEPLDMLITFPQPAAMELPRYYESEDYISHTDARRNLLEKVYHWVKSYSLKRKLKLIEQVGFQSGREMLDIGCGTGDFLKTCQEGSWTVTGIEPSLKAREACKAKLAGAGEVYESLEELIENNKKTYDVITLWHVMEHVPDLISYLERIKELIGPGGVLIVAVPNYRSDDAHSYGKHWAAYDVPRHLWHFSRKSVERICTQIGLRVVEELPLIFDSYYVSLLSEKYMSGKQNFLRAFYRGLRSNWKARSSGEYSSVIYIIKP